MQLLDDLREKKRRWNLKEKALYGELAQEGTMDLQQERDYAPDWQQR